MRHQPADAVNEQLTLCGCEVAAGLQERGDAVADVLACLDARAEQGREPLLVPEPQCVQRGRPRCPVPVGRGVRVDLGGVRGALATPFGLAPGGRVDPELGIPCRAARLARSMSRARSSAVSSRRNGLASCCRKLNVAWSRSAGTGARKRPAPRLGAREATPCGRSCQRSRAAQRQPDPACGQGVADLAGVGHRPGEPGKTGAVAVGGGQAVVEVNPVLGDAEAEQDLALAVRSCSSVEHLA
jgi:hypothetical protein